MEYLGKVLRPSITTQSQKFVLKAFRLPNFTSNILHKIVEEVK